VQTCGTVAATDPLDFRVLGPLQVATNGTHLPLGGAKQRAVLALLLLHANEVVSVDRLIDELWGESPPGSAANIVQGYVSHLRKALEPGRGRGEHELLVSRPPGYALLLTPSQLDAKRFELLAGEGRRLLDEGDAGAAAERLRDALALWRGPPLADLAYEPFVRPDADRLEELRLAALEDRIDADLALGREGALVGELRELVAGHPLRERLRGQLMAALYRSGRQAEALDVYRDGRRVLSDELGIEPGPALRELERSILQHDPALGGPAPPPTAIMRRRRWPLVAPAGAVAAVAAAASVLLATRGGSPRPVPVVVYPNSVAVIDPATSAVVDDVIVGDYPIPLAADARYLYVGNNGDATVSQIRLTDRRVFGTFALSRATDLVAGPGGSLWAADGGEPGHTPIGVGPGTVLEYGQEPTLRPIRVGPSINSANGLDDETTLAADGPTSYGVWVGNQATATLRELDRGLGTTLLTLHGIAPGGLAVVGNSSDDTVWASEPGSDLVVRVDSSARRVVRRIRVPDGPTRLAADAHAVWAITGGARHELWRLDPATGRKVRIPLPITPARVALGADSVWVTGYVWSNGVDAARGGILLRIDPATNRIVARIPLGDLAPEGILAVDGLVWVAVAPSG
jgi:DNA-binding SARP family transcriptional activator